MVGVSQGLNLDNLDETAPEEMDEYLRRRWVGRGPLYDLYATSLMADHAPDFLKLHRWGADALRLLPSERGLTEPGEIDEAFRRNEPVCTIPQLYSYMMLGWETGIRNEFHVLRRLGFTRAQIMEIVLFARLRAGMRGLGHAYHAVGDFLPDYEDGHGDPVFPEGWTPDPDAFKCGLDLSTRALTEEDRRNMTEWYERTIGYVPNSVAFGMKYDPMFFKAHRAMWEVAIKTLPKQVAPYLMLRDSIEANDGEGLREAALLGKAWGISADWIVRGVMYTIQYFTSLRGLYVAHEALDDLLEHWDD